MLISSIHLYTPLLQISQFEKNKNFHLSSREVKPIDLH